MISKQTRHSPVNRILDALADKENADPTALDPPLAEVIDPDALDALLEREPPTEGRGLEIRFTYRGHNVVVSRNGAIEIT